MREIESECTKGRTAKSACEQVLGSNVTASTPLPVLQAGASYSSQALLRKYQEQFNSSNRLQSEAARPSRNSSQVQLQWALPQSVPQSVHHAIERNSDTTKQGSTGSFPLNAQLFCPRGLQWPTSCHSPSASPHQPCRLRPADSALQTQTCKSRPGTHLEDCNGGSVQQGSKEQPGAHHPAQVAGPGQHIPRPDIL